MICRSKVIFFNMVFGGHLGIYKLQLPQNCGLGNQAEFVLLPYTSTNQSIKFIGNNISRFKKNLLDYRAVRPLKSNFI